MLKDGPSKSRGQKCVGMFITGKYRKGSRYHIKVSYCMPSSKAWGRSASWHLVEIITALARIKVNDNLPNSWLVTTLSSTPLHLASAAASCLAMATAPGCRPPKVSIANGRKAMPSWRQASAVSFIFLL